MFGLSAKALAITGLVGLVAGSIAGTAATATFYEKMIVPGREDAAELRAETACLEKTAVLSKAAAAEAVAGEMARRSAAINAAVDAYRLVSADYQAKAAEQLQSLEEENKRYAKDLEKAGKSCPLDDDGMRFLGGVPG